MNEYEENAVMIKNLVDELCAKYIPPTPNEVGDRNIRIIEEISSRLGCSYEIAVEIFGNSNDRKKMIEICKKIDLKSSTSRME